MNRLFSAALLSCAAASLSNPSWSFQGFDFFQQIEQSIECVRKPGTDMLVCSNKFVPADDEEEETTPEPVVDTTPQEPQYDLYNREIQELLGLIDFPECSNPNPNLIKTMLDVDLDGDQDVIMGFECLLYTQDVEDLKPQLTYDEFFGWITDSYLAVFINDNGVFRNDQSVFGGEYPVYDHTLKSWWAINVGDINGDGYDDLSIHHHWDNSEFNAINERLIRGNDRDNILASEYWNAGSVIISDGEGGYKVHKLPMQTWQSVPQFYTDELGDTYVWLFAERNIMFGGEYGAWDDYQKRELDLEVRPYVGKVVSGGDLIDVTDRYWEKLYPTDPNDVGVWCYIPRDKAVNGEYPKHASSEWQMPCNNPDNWLPTNYSVEHMDGKVYVNTARHIMHNNLYSGDERIAHCINQNKSGTLQDQHRAFVQCKLDATTNQPWMFDSLAVLAMDSERGVYVEDTKQHQGEFRYYLKDPNKPVSQGGEYETALFLDLGDQIQLHAWGWGMAIAKEPGTGDTIVLNNMGGVLLDPGATLDDFEELALYVIREFDPQEGDWSNSIGKNLTDPRRIFAIMESGFCPDVLDVVEPEDCIDPEYWTENLTNRYQDFGRDNGASIGFRIDRDTNEIVSEPKLTNLNMAYNTRRTYLIDFDSDGDLDLYINDNNQDCGPMCLMENIGDYEFEQNLEGVWGQADDAFWSFQYEQCKGPQRPGDGWVGGGLCNLNNPEDGYMQGDDINGLFMVSTGEINITDIDGDGILDFYALKYINYWNRNKDSWASDMDLHIMYGE